MLFNTSTIAIGFFQAIENAKSISENLCENCITVGVGNTLVNIDRHNSLIAKLIKNQNCSNFMDCS